MLKFSLVAIALLTISLSTFAQRLYLPDVIRIYDTMASDPQNCLNNLDKLLNSYSSGWKGPDLVEDNGLIATWRYMVGEGTYGRVRFIIQNLEGQRLPKISYECPYISSYEDYADELRSHGAQLRDSYTDKDKTLVTVFTKAKYTYMLFRYPLSISHYTADGKPTAYFKILMHPSLK